MTTPADELASALVGLIEKGHSQRDVEAMCILETLHMLKEGHVQVPQEALESIERFGRRVGIPETASDQEFSHALWAHFERNPIPETLIRAARQEVQQVANREASKKENRQAKARAFLGF